MSYDDAKYGVIERWWSGLTVKMGGSTAAAHLIPAAAEAAKVTRWYPPRGPIVVKKFGVMTVATGGDGEHTFILKKGVAATGTRIAAVTASTDDTPFTIASNASPASFNIAAGSYLSILASTNVCSTGSYAFFVDFVRRYDNSGKHDA